MKHSFSCSNGSARTLAIHNNVIDHIGFDSNALNLFKDNNIILTNKKITTWRNVDLFSTPSDQHLRKQC